MSCSGRWPFKMCTPSGFLLSPTISSLHHSMFNQSFSLCAQVLPILWLTNSLVSATCSQSTALASCLSWNRAPSQKAPLPHSNGDPSFPYTTQSLWWSSLLSWTPVPYVQQSTRQLYSDVPQTPKFHHVTNQLKFFPPKSSPHPVNENTINPATKAKDI